MIQTLSYEQAIKLINFNGAIGLVDCLRQMEHHIQPTHCIFDVMQIKQLLRDWSSTVQLSGIVARKNGYGVVLCDNYGYLFLNTIPEEMEKLKIIDSEHHFPIN